MYQLLIHYLINTHNTRPDIFLEMFAVLFGLISVWYSKRNNILVFQQG